MHEEKNQHHQPTIAPESLLITLSCLGFFFFFTSLITSCFTFYFFVPLSPPLECKLLERKEGFLSLQNHIFTWSAGILFVGGGEHDPAQVLRTPVGLGGYLQWGDDRGRDSYMYGHIQRECSNK